MGGKRTVTLERFRRYLSGEDDWLSRGDWTNVGSRLRSFSLPADRKPKVLPRPLPPVRMRVNLRPFYRGLTFAKLLDIPAYDSTRWKETECGWVVVYIEERDRVVARSGRKPSLDWYDERG